MANELVSVGFHGDELLALREGDEIYVGVRRVCEVVGVVYQTQIDKLKAAKWSTLTFRVMVADDGKDRNTAVVSLKALPMWLATISPNRVDASVREKLELYQQEAADVLHDHFFGQPPTPTPTYDPNDSLSVLLHTTLQNRMAQLRLEAEQAAQLALINEVREAAEEAKQVANAALAERVNQQDYYEIKGYAALHGYLLTGGQLSAIGRKAAAMCRELGIEIRYRQNASYGRVGVYPTHILDQLRPEFEKFSVTPQLAVLTK